MPVSVWLSVCLALLACQCRAVYQAKNRTSYQVEYRIVYKDEYKAVYQAEYRTVYRVVYQTEGSIYVREGTENSLTLRVQFSPTEKEKIKTKFQLS